MCTSTSVCGVFYAPIERIHPSVYHLISMRGPSPPTIATTEPFHGSGRMISKHRDRKTGLTLRQSAFCHNFVMGPLWIRCRPGICYAVSFGWLEANEQTTAGLPPKKRWMSQELGQRILQKPKIDTQINRLRDQLAQETSLSRPSWVADALTMRDQAKEVNNFAAARAFHRDIGECLGHFTTRIEITHQERSSDVMAELAELVAQFPELLNTPEMKRIDSITHPTIELAGDTDIDVDPGDELVTPPALMGDEFDDVGEADD